MAGDWIKIQHVTPDKPEVWRIADTLGIDADAVVGKLVRIWIWADQQTTDGNAGSVTSAMLDRISGVTGFVAAMTKAGWLEQSEEGFRFVNFDRHNGETAKQRALVAKRVQKHRAKAADTESSPDNSNAESVTSGLPEKRREEVDIKHTDAGASCADVATQRPAQQVNPPAPPKRKPRPPKQLCEESEAVAEFPVVGGGVWWLPGWKADEWTEVFTGVDVPSEVNKALQWLRDNPAKRKTHRGMLRFLNQWIERAQNDAGRRQAGRQADWQNHEQRRENSNAAAIAAVRAKYQSHQQHARIDGDSDGGAGTRRSSAGALFE